MRTRTSCLIGILVAASLAGGHSTAIAQVIYYVNGDCGDDSWTGTSSVCRAPDGPKASIQAAITVAGDGDEVVVAAGMYLETIDFLGKAITVRSSDGAEVTTIDAQVAGSVVTCDSGETRDSVLDGFTITGGDATAGGGMRIYQSEPVVTNCTFAGNSATQFGGGLYSYNDLVDCMPLVSRCTFIGNSADIGGGGLSSVASHAGQIEVSKCTFVDNSADYGGGMYAGLSAATITDCMFYGNSAMEGGGLWDYAYSSRVRNCGFAGNSADEGGAIWLGGSFTVLTNCAITQNSAEVGGGILTSAYNASTTVNCILWENANGEIVDQENPSAVTFSDVQGGWEGEGNIDADPLFLDVDGADDILGTVDDNLRLPPASPCVESGSDQAVPEDVLLDADGNARIADGDLDGQATVDMGAYELPGDCNGNGILDHIDISEGTSQDCNANGVPDECDVASGASEDCNANEIPDDCEDCNANGLADSCDIADGSSEDCNGNGIPDECVELEDDCNANGIPDECIELEDDCNANAVPDECDIAVGTSKDCNENQVPDECDVAGGTSQDCDENGIPDECDLLFVEQIITTEADYTYSVFAADLDGDGDIDVLSASFNDHKIAWYENTDGLGSFGPQQIITTEATQAISVFAADLDGDGDIDVLSASVQDTIAWYENTDGLGSFGPQQIITTEADGASSVFAADLDGDGDSDVLSASAYDNKIAWYENTDGLGGFGPRQIITNAAAYAESVFAADLDGDGDTDVLSASWGDDKIAWYRNTDGLGSFGPQQIITTEANGAWSVFAADLDGDGDHDVLSASALDDKIAWYENTDGLGSFGPQQIITTEANDARSVFAADLYGDGNTDVLSASRDDDKIAWYETPSDCNGNAIPDVCDIAEGTSEDCNGNGNPDECEPDVPCPCEGDVNGDGTVDPLDAGFVLSRFGCVVGAGDPDCDTADQNDDGTVDPLDVGFVLARFGECE